MDVLFDADKPMALLGSGFILSSIILLCYVLHIYVTRYRVVPKGVPWVGVRNEIFAKQRAHWREWTHSKENVDTGYTRYSKRSLPFVTPNITHTPEVILPPDYIKWLIDQPDDVLSIREVLIEDVNFNYTSPRSWHFSRPFHVEALNKMHLDLMTPEIIDEIDLCLAQFFGTNTNTWTKIPLYSAVWNSISRITNRVFVGLPLAHTPSYIDATTTFITSILRQSTIITLFVPSLLRPLLGHLIALPCRYHDHRCATHLVPLIQKYLASELGQGPSTGTLSEKNPTLLQVMTGYAARSTDPLDHSALHLCSRLLALNFVGTHTTTSAATNAFLDIASAPPAVYTALRSEATSVLRAANETWTKSAVAKLHHLDSCLRESLRLSAFKARGLERRVVAPHGVHLPDGTFLPRGTKLGVPTTGIHTDPVFYPDHPDEFISDRFLVGGGGPGDNSGGAGLGMVNTTSTFLPFGHGRHACPGRFLASYELKLLFAMFILNYDIEFLDRRPVGGWVSDFCVPPGVGLGVRRRERSAWSEGE